MAKYYVCTIDKWLKRRSDCDCSSTIVLKRHSDFKIIKTNVKFDQNWSSGRPTSRSWGVLGDLRHLRSLIPSRFVAERGSIRGGLWIFSRNSWMEGAAATLSVWAHGPATSVRGCHRQKGAPCALRETAVDESLPYWPGEWVVNDVW